MEEKKEHIITISVNGNDKRWEKGKISYEEVLILAFGSYSTDQSTAYTVTYSRGHANKPQGKLVEAESVEVVKEMNFVATKTTRS